MLSVPSAEATETADFEPGLEGRRPAIPQTASLPAARGCSTATPKADQKSARPARRYLPDDPYVAATGPDPASTSKPNASALQARASAAMDRAQRMHPDLEASRRPHVSPQRRRQGFATGLARSHPSSRGLSKSHCKHSYSFSGLSGFPRPTRLAPAHRRLPHGGGLHPHRPVELPRGHRRRPLRDGVGPSNCLRLQGRRGSLLVIEPETGSSY